MPPIHVLKRQRLQNLVNSLEKEVGEVYEDIRELDTDPGQYDPVKRRERVAWLLQLNLMIEEILKQDAAT